MNINYSILHISDLHRINTDNIDCLISSFEIEKSKYESLGIPKVRLIVVSGDIVNGSNNTDSKIAKEEIKKQYIAADLFLKKLCSLFIGSSIEDRMHVIIVPGNHDMSRYMSHLCMEPIERDDIEFLTNALWRDNSDIRWSWKNLQFYHIAREEIYNNRFCDFIDFYNNFYEGHRMYPLEHNKQSVLIDIPDLNISLACFNSCYRLDHLRHSGYISPQSLSVLTKSLLEATKKGRMIFGVWHHHTNGRPNENNYLDDSILDNMVQNGILIALHGHQHINGIVHEYKDVLSDLKLSMISAGTLYGDASDLPISGKRQYNLIAINMNDDYSDVTLFSREDNTSLNEIPSWDIGNIGKSKRHSYTFKINLPHVENISEEQELQNRINNINIQAERTGDFNLAVHQLAELGLEKPIVRKFVLSLLSRANNFKCIIELFSTPKNLSEAITVINCCLQTGDFKSLTNILDSEFVRSSTDSSLQTIIEEAKFQLKLKKHQL
ncbi:MAG: metallophosphoesterase [Muribaculaceae bacterium]|nr:metallophosphoesterase [Muribaculaceae bacterium]